MEKNVNAVIGNWYKRTDYDGLFEVVAIDHDDGTIELQYFDGAIEEIDTNTWSAWQLEPAAQPEDWSGALQMEAHEIRDEFSGNGKDLDDALSSLDGDA